MTAKAVFPLVESGNQGGIRLLGVDQHNIVQRIAMKPAHGGQVIPVTVRFKKFLDTFFNSGSDFFDTFFVGLRWTHAGSLLTYRKIYSLFFVIEGKCNIIDQVFDINGRNRDDKIYGKMVP